MATYRTFDGADITMTFNGQVIGNVQAMTYTATRNDAPIYEIGNVANGYWLATDIGHGVKTAGKRAGQFFFDKLAEEEIKSEKLEKLFKKVTIKRNLVNEDYSALLNEGELF